jgi:U3 small nucleolar ribonucleoprotein protein IMP4
VLVKLGRRFEAQEMIRRNARLRREYLYRKNLEGKERATYERKKKIKECLANGTPIPTELRDDEEHLRCLRTASKVP